MNNPNPGSDEAMTPKDTTIREILKQLIANTPSALTERTREKWQHELDKAEAAIRDFYEAPTHKKINGVDGYYGPDVPVDQESK